MTDIVQLNTQDVSYAIPVTTSIIVAEMFDKRHDNVIRDIESICFSLCKDVPNFGDIYLCQGSSEKDMYGRERKTFVMNESFFMLLVMGFTGDKALKIKTQFIKSFYIMKKELLARTATRHIGKVARLSITDAIRDHVTDGTTFKKFAYGNYTKLVYKRILGMDVKRAKEIRNVPESGNLRDFLTIDELEKVQELEGKIAGFIEISDTECKNDKEVYAMVKTYVDGLNQP